MTRFKVGDKVRRIIDSNSDGNGHTVHVGDVLTVSRAKDFPVCGQLLGMTETPFWEYGHAGDRYELVEEPAPTFKVGDKVRCIRLPNIEDLSGGPFTVSHVEVEVPGATLLGLAELGHTRGEWDSTRFERVGAQPPFKAGDRVKQLVYGAERVAVFDAVVRERTRQDAKFGKFGGLDEKSCYEQLAVLTEEVGELAQAINDGDLRHAHEELVQCAAVCIAMLEAAEAYPPKGSL